MAWIRYSTAIGNDAEPLSSAIGVDVLRNNVIELLGASPASCACVIHNDGVVGLHSNAAGATDAAVLARFSRTYLRSRLAYAVRGVRLYVFAWMDTLGARGTVRLVASPSDEMPAATPVAPAAYVETAAGSITHNGGVGRWYMLPNVLWMTNAQTHQIMTGTARADRAGIAYPTVYFTIQGWRTAGAGNICVSRHTFFEED
jgi:hypothetical protein